MFDENQDFKTYFENKTKEFQKYCEGEIKKFTDKNKEILSEITKQHLKNAQTFFENSQKSDLQIFENQLKEIEKFRKIGHPKVVIDSMIEVAKITLEGSIKINEAIFKSMLL